jgi:hypothetical protein
MWHLVPGRDRIDRRKKLSPQQFLARYYSANLPVFIPGFASRWPALKKWTPAYFKRRFADVPVEVASGREGTYLFDFHVKEISKTVPFGEYIDWVESNPGSNDRYLVANNDGLAKGRLRALLDDVRYARGWLDPKKIEGCVYIWYGPKGTVTPLHHDASNILFCQVRGRKLVKLVSPVYAKLAEHAVSYYSLLDLDANPKELAGVRVLEQLLTPGDALFIPSGWWHHVRSLDASVSVSLTNFVFYNE